MANNGLANPQTPRKVNVFRVAKWLGITGTSVLVLLASFSVGGWLPFMALLLVAFSGYNLYRSATA